jgi:hypothetical protein
MKGESFSTAAVPVLLLTHVVCQCRGAPAWGGTSLLTHTKHVNEPIQRNWHQTEVLGHEA